MRFIISATLLSLASFASAQTSASSTPAAAPAIPVCVSTCFVSTAPVAAGCTSTDVPCLCKSTPFVAALATCFQTTCSSAADAAYGTQFGIATCATVGVTVVVPASSAGVSSAAKTASGTTVASVASTASVIAPASTSAKSGSNKLAMSTSIFATIAAALFAL